MTPRISTNFVPVIFWYSFLLHNCTEGVPSPISQNASSVCGGHIVGSGEIHYKVGQQYSPNEQCVWTLINKEYPLLSLEMIEGRFADAGDNLEIFYYKNGSLLNPVAGTGPHCDGSFLSRRGDFCMVKSSLVFLVFRSNQAIHGTGFSIKIQPVKSDGMLPPSGESYEPHTLDKATGDYVDYTGDLKTRKLVSWTLVHPSEFVLFRYNISAPCNTTSISPSFTIYQTNKGSPTKLDSVCGRINQPITWLVQGPLEAEPFVIIYENGKRSYSGGEIKFYWNLDEPPEKWKPEPGSASRFGQGSLVTFIWSGMVFLLTLVTRRRA